MMICRTIISQTSNSSKDYEKMPHFDHFPRPGEIDPYMTKATKRATKTITNGDITVDFHLKLLLNHQRLGYRQIPMDYQHQ